MKQVDARYVYQTAKEIGDTITMKQLYDILDNAPERVAEWKPTLERAIKCSACGAIMVSIAETRNQSYCPACGAKMKGVSK